MMGFDCPYIPGWDCHGLPIEHQVDKELKAKKQVLPQVEVRARCRAYARRFIDIQREEFKRLGVLGDWERPYLTMNPEYVATILAEYGKFFLSGAVYRSKKPVHWCATCRTALAEAEVEYEDHRTPSVYVKFPLVSPPPGLPELGSGGPVFLVIWTTTPWTLPANLAIAAHPDLEYAVLEVNGERLVVAADLAAMLLAAWGLAGKEVQRVPGTAPGGRHRPPPLDRPHLPGHFGRTTSRWRRAPGWCTSPRGTARRTMTSAAATAWRPTPRWTTTAALPARCPSSQGLGVWDANQGIIDLLRQRGALLLGKRKSATATPTAGAASSPSSSGPRSSGSSPWSQRPAGKGPGGHRPGDLDSPLGPGAHLPDGGAAPTGASPASGPGACPSWPFTVSLRRGAADPGDLDRILAGRAGKGRILVCPAGRGNYCPRGPAAPVRRRGLRQRNRHPGRVVRLRGELAAVVEPDPELGLPADLYLEGSDQHRGWFHSSLLTAVGTRGQAPYRGVLTHGFVVDGDGRKMSKSMGNVIAPQEVMAKFGAEILRLWVAAEDYRDDVRLSDNILKQLGDAYRRFRNTARFILGNLYDFDPEKDLVPLEDREELDRLALSWLAQLAERVKRAYQEYEFHLVFHRLHQFCAVEMSALYLDILKDRLYISRPEPRPGRAPRAPYMKFCWTSPGSWPPFCPLPPRKSGAIARGRAGGQRAPGRLSGAQAGPARRGLAGQV
jgi:isoleucyl-tRNA synthetase